MLINVKMPTIVGILTFMSMINFIFSCVEHEKGFSSKSKTGLSTYMRQERISGELAHMNRLRHNLKTLFHIWSLDLELTSICS